MKKFPLLPLEMPSLREGREVCLLATGVVLPMVLDAADLLEEQGVSTRVLSMPTVKPLNTELLKEVFSTSEVVGIVEEHSLLGGTSGSIAEWWADDGGGGARLMRFGTPDRFIEYTGGQHDARRRIGLTAEHVAQRCIEVLQGSAV